MRKVKRAKPKIKKSKPMKTGSKAKKAIKAPKTKRGVSKKDVNLEKVGEVTHYFPQVKAAAVSILKDGLKVGDGIYIKGHTTDFKEKIKSMQLDRVDIRDGRKGQEIGLLVKSRVRIGDSVYKII